MEDKKLKNLEQNVGCLQFFVILLVIIQIITWIL
jgi:hypothetical protein